MIVIAKLFIIMLKLINNADYNYDASDDLLFFFITLLAIFTQ